MRAGYRDRVFTELAQNAADAAARANVPGHIGVRLADAPQTRGSAPAHGQLALHVTNTGAPLDLDGVQALAALRASGKDVSAVGRFGVGFTAVLTISDDVEIRSTSGSIRFSAALTAAELDSRGIERTITPATLRLPWPIDVAPPPGVTTEVVARLRPGIDASALLDGIAEEAPDLLLELPTLESITIGATRVRRDATARPDGVEVITVGAQTWWQYRTDRARWLLPIVDGRPTPLGNDVLRAPTHSDEELSLPTMVIADVEMQPDRRRIMPGTDIAGLAHGYAGFARASLAEADLVLVPRPSFARSEVDRVLREAVLTELRQTPWLPVVGSDEPVAPARASMLPGLTPDLADLLTDVVPALLPPELSGHEQERPLAELDVHRIGLAHLAELLAGLDRSPQWWGRLYAALDPLVVDRVAVEELGALPVPLADGRTVTGPRTTVTSRDAVGGSGSEAGIPVHWARLVHPAAFHPLLARLGARESTPLDLLCDPALHAAIEDAADRLDHDRSDAVTDLGAAVLTLAGSVDDPTQLPAWLGGIPLPANDADLYPADELLLSGAPLAQVLVPDAPFAVVDAALERRFGRAALEAVGVAWSFGVLRVPDPTGPDHHLDDEERWWDSLADDPPELLAVRDLDLVAPAAWPRALALLAADRRIRPLLADADGYTAWWLRHHAVIDGQPLGLLRPADDTTFAGLLDPLDDPGLDGAATQALRAALADPSRLDIDLARVLVERLGDPDRTPTPGIVADVHRRLAVSVTSGALTPGDIALPAQVRTVAGTLADPDDVVVLDLPWFAAAIPPHRLVVGALDSSPALATLLDLRLASQAVGAEVLGSGCETDWFTDAFGVLAQLATGRSPTPGRLIIHDELRVRLFGAVETVAAVPFWFDPDGTGHLAAQQHAD